MQTDHRIAEKMVTEKQQEQKAAPVEAWKERLCRLSNEEQAHIAKKYYGGHYPWKG